MKLAIIAEEFGCLDCRGGPCGRPNRRDIEVPHQRAATRAAPTGAAFDFLSKQNLDYLECEVFEENEPSLSFITWVGFRPVGELIVKAPSVDDVNPLEHI